MPISFAIQGPEIKQIIENIIKQNYIIAGLTIKRLAWKRLKKVKLLLIIGVQSKEMANALFNWGIFFLKRKLLFNYKA